MYGYQTSTLRIHVERQISRLKTFGIMRPITDVLYEDINKVVTCVCFLSNLFKDLIKEQ